MPALAAISAMTALDPAEEVQHDADARQGVVDLFRTMTADLERRWMSAHTEDSGEASPARGPEATLGEVVDRLDERAFGMLMLLLALPCIPPFVYILPQIVSLPILALGLQMAAGRQSPWLPQKFRERRFPLREFSKVLDFSEKYVRWVEAIARPRFPKITGRVGARIVGALMIVPAVSILAPLIGTNTVPSAGIAVASLGLIQRDGLLVVLGMTIGVGWVALFVAVALFFGVELVALLKEQLAAIF